MATYIKKDDDKIIDGDFYVSTKGNIVVHYKGELGEIANSVYNYSDISGNKVYRFNSKDKLFSDAESGNYEIRKDIPYLENIPFNEIGRVSK